MDYAVDAGAFSMDFNVTKGAVGKFSLWVYYVDDKGNESPLGNYQESGGNKLDPVKNMMNFSVDLSSLNSVAPQTKNIVSPNLPKMLWAFYYIWYDKTSRTLDKLEDHPLEPAFNSADPETIIRHIDQAKAAGIDGFLVSWWVPNNYTDNTFKKLLEIAQKKIFRLHWRLKLWWITNLVMSRIFMIGFHIISLHIVTILRYIN